MRSFGAILWKEWLGLQPFRMLLLFVFLVFLVLTSVTEFIDEQFVWDTLISQSTFAGVVTFILCVIVSMGLLTREKDEGHLIFLDGLPLSRFSVYLAKSLLAFFLVTLITLVWTAESLVYEFLSRESNSPAVPWKHIGVFTLLNGLLSAFFLAVLLPLSFLRLWSLLVLGLLFWLLIVLKGMDLPFAVWLDPFEMMKPPPRIEDKWIIPWTQVGVLAASGLVSWLVGYAVFARQTGSRGALRHLREAWVAKLAGAASVVAILVIWFSLFVWFSLQHADEADFDAGGLSGADMRPEAEGGNAIATLRTEKFEFVYRRKSEDVVAKLAASADELFVRVADYLEAQPEARTGRTVVDLSNPVGSHNAGQAYWKKIRMVIPRDADESELEAILGHEITHVLAERITDGRLGETFDATRWFHEGLASYVEFRFFRQPGEEEAYEKWTALASTWGEVDFRELVSSLELGKRRDPNLVYPAGMIWVEAAVDVYGERCPAELLRAIGREDGPRKLAGMARWRDACLAAGFDLERIRSRFRARLQLLREEHAEICGRLPEISEAAVRRLDGKIVITPDLPAGWRDNLPEGAVSVCRVRPDEGALPSQWRYSKLGEDGAFRVSELHFPHPRIGFQIGWRIEKWCPHAVFGQWVETTVP